MHSWFEIVFKIKNVDEPKCKLINNNFNNTFFLLWYRTGWSDYNHSVIVTDRKEITTYTSQNKWLIKRYYPSTNSSCIKNNNYNWFTTMKSKIMRK